MLQKGFPLQSGQRGAPQWSQGFFPGPTCRPSCRPTFKVHKRTKGPFILPSLEGLEVESGYLFPLRHICQIICTGMHNWLPALCMNWTSLFFSNSWRDFSPPDAQLQNRPSPSSTHACATHTAPPHMGTEDNCSNLPEPKDHDSQCSMVLFESLFFY